LTQVNPVRRSRTAGDAVQHAMADEASFTNRMTRVSAWLAQRLESVT